MVATLLLLCSTWFLGRSDPSSGWLALPTFRIALKVQQAVPYFQPSSALGDLINDFLFYIVSSGLSSVEFPLFSVLVAALSAAKSVTPLSLHKSSLGLCIPIMFFVLILL